MINDAAIECNKNGRNRKFTKEENTRAECGKWMGHHFFVGHDSLSEQRLGNPRPAHYNRRQSVIKCLCRICCSFFKGPRLPIMRKQLLDDEEITVQE